jgi:ABC-type proline/glycine betaine transport system substrate-binding protein/ABC-type amino acid transport substrate-binding protein
MAGVRSIGSDATARIVAVTAMGKRFLFGIGIWLILVPFAGHQVVAQDQLQRLQTSDTMRSAPAETISIARATWDTGWFQTEIFIKLLEELGYPVAYPQTMDNLAFYLAAARGEVDLWVNGWFPSHNVFLKQDAVKGKVQPVGFEVIAGALQGYMVDKRTADALKITSLGDLKKPDVAAVFDRNGNGKADLIGCNVGWGCERVVEHHLDAYDLRATVEQVQGDYSPLMDDVIARYKRGEPILFYTWTPNWTVGTLVPGKDVVWLPVPFPSLPIDQQDMEDHTIIAGVPGCEADPCAMGFPPNDIRVVANKQFLEKYPDIRRLLESVEIPLEDISRQNAKMLDGEDDYADIQRHAQQWIQGNRDKIDRWLQEARTLKASREDIRLPEGERGTKSKAKVLRVVTQRSEPFVIYQDGEYHGFSIELWEKIAHKLGLKYEIYGVNTIAKLLDDVRRGAADVAVSGIGITSKREQVLDFSHSYFESGLQIMIPNASGSLPGDILSKVVAILFSQKLLIGVGVFLIVLLIAAHIIWLLERRHNPQFSESYPQGLWQSIWWAVVTVTTVGYGDKTPKGTIGRLFALFWILAGYFVFAYFTASVSSTATVQKLHGTINGPEDLFGKRVATVQKSTAAEYLAAQGMQTIELENVEKGYRLLEIGKVDAVVYDAPVLQHYASKKGKGKVQVVGLIFKEKSYGIALPRKSDLRDRINVALLQLEESGEYKEIGKKWFGP